MLGEVEPDSLSQVKSHSGDIGIDSRRAGADAMASEGPDSTVMAGGIEFGNDNMSNPIYKNNE